MNIRMSYSNIKLNCLSKLRFRTMPLFGSLSLKQIDDPQTWKRNLQRGRRFQSRRRPLPEPAVLPHHLPAVDVSARSGVKSKRPRGREGFTSSRSVREKTRGWDLMQSEAPTIQIQGVMNRNDFRMRMYPNIAISTINKN